MRTIETHSLQAWRAEFSQHTIASSNTDTLRNRWWRIDTESNEGKAIYAEITRRAARADALTMRHQTRSYLPH